MHSAQLGGGGGSGGLGAIVVRWPGGGGRLWLGLVHWGRAFG